MFRNFDILHINVFVYLYYWPISPRPLSILCGFFFFFFLLKQEKQLHLFSGSLYRSNCSGPTSEFIFFSLTRARMTLQVVFVFVVLDIELSVLKSELSISWVVSNRLDVKVRQADHPELSHHSKKTEWERGRERDRQTDREKKESKTKRGKEAETQTDRLAGR